MYEAANVRRKVRIVITRRSAISGNVEIAAAVFNEAARNSAIAFESKMVYTYGVIKSLICAYFKGF